MIRPFSLSSSGLRRGVPLFLTAAAAFFFLLGLPALSQAGTISTVAGIAAGGTHSAQIRADGTLWTWGSNGSGQLGCDTGPDNISTSPRQVGADSDWARLALGANHTVALKADGSLWAWGRNLEGQLGDGTNAGKSAPTWIEADSDWVMVAVGDKHTVALKTDGTLWAWGSNIFGQLGDGTTETRFVPRQVGADSDWRTAAAGSFFNLAVKADGSLWAWGYNFSGQVGDGTSGVNRLLPVRIGSPDIVWRDVAAGSEHALALDADGNLWAWGRNDWGQLGDGTTVASLLPLQVTSSVAWRKVVAGGNFSAGVRADGTLWTWGDNSWGQLGDGSGGLGFFRSSPAEVAAGVLDMAAGDNHTLALLADDTVLAWGSNQNGQLGDGTQNDTVARTVSIDSVVTPINIPSQTISGTADLQTVRVSMLVTDAAGNVVSIGDATLTGTSWSYHVTGLAEGENTIVATATDDAQFDTARAMTVILYDLTPPRAPLLSGSDLTNDPTPTWSWASGGGGHGTFRYRLNGGAWSAETEATSFTPADPLQSPNTEGEHILEVQERDVVGNWSASGSQTIVVDTLPPAPPQVTGPDVTNNPTPTWSWSLGGGNGTFRHRLNSGVWSAETEATSFTPADPLQSPNTGGEHTLYVQERDAAGNWSPSGSRTIEIDIVRPSLLVIEPISPTNLPDLTLIGNVEAGATPAVTADTVATITPPNVFAGNFLCQINGLAEGTNIVTVTATDAAGNQAVITVTIEVDTTPPAVTFDYYATPTNSPSQMIRGSREAGVEVSFPSDPDVAIGPVSYPTADTWSFFVTGLAPGENSIEATATDAAGNVTRVARTISHDPAVPTLTIDSLATPVNVSSQTIGGRRTADAAVSVLVGPGAVIGPVTYPTPDTWSCSLDGLAEGANAVVVTATGPAAGTGAEAFATIIFDPAAPTVTLDILVTPTNKPDQTIGGSRSAGTTIAVATEFWAMVDDVVYPTETTWSCAVSGLIEANNIVVVTAVGFDESGASLFRNVSYDAAAPAVTVNPPVNPTSQSSVTLTGTTETGATVTVANATAGDSGVAVVADDAWTYDLATLVPGNNVINVVATDAVGNQSDPVTTTIYCDNTPPTVTILTPEMGKRYSVPVLNYTVSDDYTTQAATAVASIVGGGTVANDDLLTGLVEGEHHLQVVATDAAGNEQTVDVMFTVDTVAPALTLDEVTSPTGSQTQTINGTVETGATVSITTNTAASDGAAVVSGGTWSYEITGLEVGDNVITVIATDAAGNPSEPLGAILTRNAAADQIIEDVGHLALDGTAKSFYTATSRQNSVVIVGPPTLHDATAGVVRLSGVTGSGFAIRFQRWGADEQAHPGESVSYLVLEEGRYAMADGSLWEVGSFSLSGTQQYTQQAFSQGFAAPPALFLTVQTTNEADAVSVRLRNVTSGTFEAALLEEEAKNNGHAAEKIGYLAIYSPKGSGVANIVQANLPYLLQQRSLGSTSAPVLSSSLRLEEETSADAETAHAAETVSVLALGSCLFAQVTSDNEADTVALRRKAPEDAAAIEWGALVLADNDWVTVPLVKGYGEPVVVAKPTSANNAEPGYVQVRNVTATSFEVRYDEWAGTWDASRRQPVQVFYLVAEKGEQNVGGLAVAAGKLTDTIARYPSWQNVAFASGFTSGPPAVFTSVQTAAGSPVVTRVQNVTDFGFEMTMQGAEADIDGAGMETHGWIAVAKGGGVTEDGRILTVFGTAVGSAPTSVNFADHYPRSISVGSFSDRFAERYRNLSKILGLEDYLRSFTYVNPVLVADLSTTREADTVSLAYRNLGNGGVELLVQEEKSLDAEIQHAAEEVSVFVAE